MNMKEVLKNKKYDCFSFKDLKVIFRSLKISELKNNISKLVKEGYLLEENERFYIKENLKTGIIDVKSAGYGFFKDEIEEVFIGENEVGSALSGDKVLVHVDYLGRKLKNGHVVKILERKTKNLAGIIHITNNALKFIPDKIDLRNYNFIVDKAGLLNLEDNIKVIVEITKYKYKNLYVKVKEILGFQDEAGVDILSIVKEKGVIDKFNFKTLKEANEISLTIAKSEIKKRKDLRNETIFTIDGSDAKDFDDAVSIKYKDGIYELGVHIADVSYYVKENSELDKEAYERGTSIYLVDRVIPMLPEVLSNGVCSLVENEDRLCISCIMHIDESGNILKKSIFPSIIKSKKRMTYDEANEILKTGSNKFSEELKLMNKLSKILIAKRETRGAINFLEKEAKIILDEQGKPVDIILRKREDSEKLIESFMIQANEVIAETMNELDLPFINRAHEKPDEEKMAEFLAQIKEMGYLDKINSDISPKDCQKILEHFEGNRLVSDRLLRSMSKAKYSIENFGHFGLASINYCHFTSPIRRYPDLIVHRLIRCFLFNNEIKDVNLWDERLDKIANHCSKMERVAIDIEREVLDMKKAEYMSSYLGMKFDGLISGVINNGYFVELENSCEGFIREENCQRVVGEKIKIQVESASKEKRQIDFKEIKGDLNEDNLPK